MDLIGLQNTMSLLVPKYWGIKLLIMPKRQKYSYWAYHRTSFLKERNQIKEAKIKIYLNLRDAPDDEKVRKEIIHEIEHIYDYTKESSLLKVIDFLRSQN